MVARFRSSLESKKRDVHRFGDKLKHFKSRNTLWDETKDFLDRNRTIKSANNEAQMTVLMNDSLRETSTLIR